MYSWQQVEELVALYLGGADRDKLDPILDVCVAEYADNLDEDGQVKFKGQAKTFVRSYGFLAAILSYGHPAWEKLSIFPNYKAYQNAQAHSDKENARLEHDRALSRVILDLLSDHTELFKQFNDNPAFKRWLRDEVFNITYNPGGMPSKMLPPTRMVLSSL